MSYLDALIYGYRTVLAAGSEMFKRSRVNFVGATVTDDPVNDWTNVAFSGASAPTGTGIPHVVGGVQDAAASLIVNADVHASAAIAGTKVDPTFGAQNVSVGATPATAGDIRLKSAVSVQGRNNANGANLTVLQTNASDELYIGCNTSFASNYTYTYLSPVTAGYLYAGSTPALIWSATNISAALPIVGYSTPYSVNGMFLKTMTAAQSYDLTGGEYSNTIFRIVSNGANVLRFPPATDAAAYTKFIWNASGGGTISVRDTNAVSAMATLSSGTGAWFLFSDASVKQITAAFSVA